MQIEKAAQSSTHSNRIVILYQGTSEYWFLSEWQKDFMGNYHKIRDIRRAKSKKNVLDGFKLLTVMGQFSEIKLPHLLNEKRFWNIEQFQ